MTVSLAHRGQLIIIKKAIDQSQFQKNHLMFLFHVSCAPLKGPGRAAVGQAQKQAEVHIHIHIRIMNVREVQLS